MMKKILFGNIVINSIMDIILFSLSYLSILQSFDYIMRWFPVFCAIAIILQVFLYAYILYISLKELSVKCQKFTKDELDQKSKTTLLDELIQTPTRIGFTSLVFSIITSFIMLLIFIIDGKADASLISVCFAECVFMSYIISVISMFYCDKVFRSYSFKIVESGINLEYIRKKKYLGLSLKTQLIMFVIIPIVIATMISLSIIIIGKIDEHSTASYFSLTRQFQRVMLISAINITAEGIIIHFFFSRIQKMSNRITDNLEAMYRKDTDAKSLLETDVSDEIAYNNYLSSEMVTMLSNIINSASEIGFKIVEGSNNLMEVSNETESTAIEQSAGIKEIVSTMQDSNVMSQNIEDKVTNVTEMARNTAQEVTEGSKVLKQNLDKISQISSSNQNTIDGIKNFNEKISSIWEVVSIINSIADQTKIIAFNAELEATNVHEKDKSFKNVANEIRRLANNTMDSTKEIKDRIDEIQSSAEQLMQSALNSNNQIKQGNNLALSLNELFSNIKGSADTNANSADEIKTLVTQQTKAFEQILKTLQEISEEIDNFSVSTGTIIDTAGLLQESVDELDSIEADDTAKGDDDGYSIEV